MVKCMPPCCPACITYATSPAANAAASCWERTYMVKNGCHVFGWEERAELKCQKLGLWIIYASIILSQPKTYSFLQYKDSDNTQAWSMKFRVCLFNGKCDGNGNSFPHLIHFPCLLGGNGKRYAHFPSFHSQGRGSELRKCAKWPKCH